MLKRNYIIATAALTLVLPVAAMAQAQAPAEAPAAATAPAAEAAPAAGAAQVGADGKIVLAPGTEVFDTQGGKVGTLTKVEGANVVLKTTKSEVLIPASSLARTEKNALIAMTAAQIDAAAAAQAPAGGGSTGGQAAAGAATTTQTSDAGVKENPSN